MYFSGRLELIPRVPLKKTENKQDRLLTLYIRCVVYFLLLYEGVCWLLDAVSWDTNSTKKIVGYLSISLAIFEHLFDFNVSFLSRKQLGW